MLFALLSNTLCLLLFCPASQCERNPCPMDSRSCRLAPKTMSYHYLSLPSNLQTPATLFRMATAAAPGRTGPDSLRFGIAGGNSRGIFVMQRSDRQTGELILVQQLRGPQEITVDVDMSEYTDRNFQAKHVARVHVLVSPYNFWKRAWRGGRLETETWRGTRKSAQWAPEFTETLSSPPPLRSRFGGHGSKFVQNYHKKKKRKKKVALFQFEI